MKSQMSVHLILQAFSSLPFFVGQFVRQLGAYEPFPTSVHFSKKSARTVDNHAARQCDLLPVACRYEDAASKMLWSIWQLAGLSRTGMENGEPIRMLRIILYAVRTTFGGLMGPSPWVSERRPSRVVSPDSR
ncbi:hypothetical protein C8R47DRAFT_790150 [Mycena vitilis]|nr:hypothetical protein C8R47DRAFT_790150 [Mycena vitilis]